MAYDRAPSFWFSLNTSYDHGHYEVVLPLVTLPSHHLVVPAGCRFASRRPSLCHRLDHCRWRTSQNWINIEVSRNKLISTLNYGIY